MQSLFFIYSDYGKPSHKILEIYFEIITSVHIYDACINNLSIFLLIVHYFFLEYCCIILCNIRFCQINLKQYIKRFYPSKKYIFMVNVMVQCNSKSI